MGALILGILAFAQFWIKIIWEKFLQKGKIDYYETGTIAIGYDHSGPTLYLQGTIRALNKDVFIRTIDLLVIREIDKAQHVFKWTFFLSPIINISGSSPNPQEIPSGFMVASNSPHRFNIAFNDSDLFRDISLLLNEYYSEWNKTTAELNKIWPPFTSVSPTPTVVKQRLEVIENFRKSKVHLDTFTALDRKCYWEPSSYQLTVNVRTSKPDVTFTKSYRFSISQVDSKNLKLNVIPMLEKPISRYLRAPDPVYNFAFSEYITE